MEKVLPEDLRREMMSIAWIPRVSYKLNFGKIDQLSEMLDDLASTHLDESNRTELSVEEIRDLILQHEQEMAGSPWPFTKQYNNLIRYAPYRLLTPWFGDELRGQDDHKKNGIIERMSNERFEKDPSYPLYKIMRSRSTGVTLVMSPRWLEYLRENYMVIQGWLDMEWLRFLEQRNTGTQNLVGKLWDQQGKRASLNVQRKFWQPVLETGFDCIYTNKEVDPADYALDHFLPWAYVAHNKLWNLVPTSHDTNSSKSDRLPPQSHVEIMAEVHIKAIKANLDISKSKPRLEEYTDWLGVDLGKKPVDFNTFKERYVRKMDLDLQSADLNGFKGIRTDQLL